jgi:hypothetical protein
MRSESGRSTQQASHLIAPRREYNHFHLVVLDSLLRVFFYQIFCSLSRHWGEEILKPTKSRNEYLGLRKWRNNKSENVISAISPLLLVIIEYY